MMSARRGRIEEEEEEDSEGMAALGSLGFVVCREKAGGRPGLESTVLRRTEGRESSLL